MMLQVPWTILDSFRGDNFSEDSFSGDSFREESFNGDGFRAAPS